MRLRKAGLTEQTEPSQELGAEGARAGRGQQRNGQQIPWEESKKQMPLQLADKCDFDFGKAETPVVLHIVPEHEK